MNPSDTSFLASVGLHREGFNKPLHSFSEYFVIKSGEGRPGRPARLPEKHVVLAMLLTVYCDTISQKRLVELFGIPRSTQSRVMRKAEIALYYALKDLHDARICWPTLEEQQR